MNQHLREQRRIATQAFLESLEQLGDQIRTEPTDAPSNAPSASTIDELEDAALDIEHLLQDENPTAP